MEREADIYQVPRHKVFVSYHHNNDQEYKDRLVGEMSEDIVDRPVEEGDVDDNLATEAIWEKIRDEYIADATVVINLIGRDTWSRKYVDWELGSALNKSNRNSRCGVLGILLPDRPDYGKRSYDPELLPPRLVANLEGDDPYVSLHDWPGDGRLSIIRGWVDDAFVRREGPPPVNHSKRFKINRDASTRRSLHALDNGGVLQREARRGRGSKRRIASSPKITRRTLDQGIARAIGRRPRRLRR